MKKFFILFALVIAYCLYSCGHKPKAPLLGYLTPNNLALQLFTIDITKDTALVTKEGIKIRIPANAIQSKSSTVTLEVKEALGIGEMLKAGLTTRSDKGILRSDGMFYINTKEESSIVKPISIDVPTEYADSKMQLYKGKEEDGRIIWKKPEALQTGVDPGIENGGTIFKVNCASCHSIDRRSTGPALGWVTKRRNVEWLREYTRDVRTLYAKGDPYACCLFKSYNGVYMMPFPALTDNEIDDIYRYINRESKRLGLPEDISASACDSCKMTSEEARKLYNKLQNLKNKKNELIDSNGTMVGLEYKRDKDNIGSEGLGIRGEINGFTPKINPPTFKAEYYKFKITVYGWYNIDDLINNANFSETELRVQLNSPQTDHINMFLVVPSEKIFTEGGLLTDNNYWGFYELNGKLNLPQGKEAYIVAIGEEAGKTFFGSVSFNINKQQTVVVNVVTKDKDSIINAMETMQLRNVFFEINKTKNHDQLKEIQRSVDSIKQILDKCSCSFAADSINFSTK